jgi:PAS domain S-box-containing protein
MKTRFSNDELKELDSLKALAIDGISDGVMICAINSDGPIIIYVNNAWQKITGYEATEVIGTKPKFLAKNDLDQPGLRDLRQAIYEQQPVTVTLRNYRKDGALFWSSLSVSPFFNQDNQLTHYFGLVRDCTAEKLAEDQLMATLRRMDTLGSLSTEGLLTFDSTGYVSYVNDAFLEFTGLSKPSVMSCNIVTFDQLFARTCCNNQSTPGLSECINDIREEQCETREIEIQHPIKRILERRIRKSEYDTMLAIYYVDITKTREIEDLKSEFMATAAHELRTPMASILGFSELLLLREFNAVDCREMLGIICTQSKRVNDLLNELLDLAKIESRKGMDFSFEVTDLRLAVEQVTRSYYANGVDLLIELPSEPHWVSIDQPKIIQALNNLISNAIKFSSPGAPVRISMTTLNCGSTNTVMLNVFDTGIGMTQEQLSHLGERFYRADNSGKILGTGLGVALVMEIAKIHKGGLQVKSEPNRGSCFSLILPLAIPDVADVTK